MYLLILIPFFAVVAFAGYFFRKGEKNVQYAVDPELIKKGTVLINAARDGKIGFTEDHVRHLQKCYLKAHQTRWYSGWKLRAFSFLIGFWIFMAGFGAWYDDLKTNAVAPEDPNFGIKMVIGVLICGGLFTYTFILNDQESKARDYISFIEKEGIVATSAT